MPERKEIQALLREPLKDALDENEQALRKIFRLPLNEDCKLRPFPAAGRDALLCYMDGISDVDLIDDYVLRASKNAQRFPQQGDIAEVFAKNALNVSEYELTTALSEVVQSVLSGKCVVVLDGCENAILIDTRKYEKRSVSRTATESVVLGPQEGFTENLRTNISLLRQQLQTGALISEGMSVGTKLPTRFALLYLDGTVNEGALQELRRRIQALDAPFVSGTGYLQQWIEDHPSSIFPQMLQTERPDRAAHALADGQIAILSENSPYALIAPITVFHLLHASDDSFMRWQYGTFVRVIRFIGILLSLYLPAVYVAICLYHTHIMPASLLTSIAETRAKVPFPVVVEVMIMEFAFLLINEAGTRIPMQMGSALGIVGALILGQAAVSASIISPIMIIIVALTGLGHFVTPNYSMSLAVQILRLLILLSGSILGLYGIVLASCVAFGQLCGMRSFGATYFAPVAPARPHRPDLIWQIPVFDRVRKSAQKRESKP